MGDFFIFILIILAVLVVLIVFLIIHFLKLKKRFDLFFKGSGIKNFEGILVEQIKKTLKQEKDIKNILKEISKLNKISEISFQKFKIKRYNPFKDVGGDQSFIIVLLDGQNNGFVINSLYTREGNRIYAKFIEQGISKYQVSEEERKLIEQAIKS